MKTYAFLAAALLVLVASLPTPHRTPDDLTDAERVRVESAVEGFLASYLEVIEAKDEEAIEKLYVADSRFAWFSDGEKRYSSADEVVAGLAAMKGMAFSTEVSDVEIIPLTLALAHARTSFQTKISQGGAVVYAFGGVITWLLEEVEDGEWRVLTGHTSTPKPR